MKLVQALIESSLEERIAIHAILELLRALRIPLITALGLLDSELIEVHKPSSCDHEFSFIYWLKKSQAELVSFQVYLRNDLTSPTEDNPGMWLVTHVECYYQHKCWFMARFNRKRELVGEINLRLVPHGLLELRQSG